MMAMVGDSGDEVVGRIICETCGSDLGPQQPFPNNCVLCKRCGKWIGNDGKAQMSKLRIRVRG